jgi:hypothetical protein
VIGNGRTPVLLILDDIQWMDEASGDLLRFVLHMGRSAPLDAVLVAREGELPDNPPITAMLRNLRREHATQDLRLSPLAAEDVALLVRTAGREEDVARIVALSNGNPLYALELTRGLAHERDALPQTLKALVRDRVERLPPEAGELLRWASVFGTGARTRLLEALCGLEPETFVNALEVVERHEMLVPAGDAYGFTHELVREAIYTALSEPRRRLMHLKLARLMREEVHQARSDPLDIAHHASVGGDTGLAALACAEAGRQALRLFANADALTLARRGQHYAEALPEPARSERLIELAEIEHGARPLNDAEGFSVRLEQLAGVALDHGSTEHAWRCYKMLADIRWATGAWSDARRDTLHAELLSRTASDEERVVALAEAARCLAMLKRDLDLAEALVLEARDLARRTQRTANAIADANGLLAMYRGEFEDARRHLREARLLARREGDRLNEFLAVEHLLVMEIEDENWTAARELCHEMRQLAEKIRPGSEQPFAEAFQAICRHVAQPCADMEAFDRAMQALRVADSKHRLAFAAVVAADVFLKQGAVARARQLAQEALEASRVLNRVNGQVGALAVLVEAAARNGEDAQAWREQLRALMAQDAGKWARSRAESALALHSRIN